jgi:alkylation response protein AidB-like acyl-CoA dehydrogenase
MNLPGMEIREIKTIAGSSDFCEVFYDEVRIPRANIVGQLNDGWNVAMSTLSFERGTAFLSEQVRLTRLVEQLIDLARRTPVAARPRARMHPWRSPTTRSAAGSHCCAPRSRRCAR